MGCNQYNIRIYLQKYWDGKTSLKEEKEIKDYFSFNHVPDDLKQDATYFKNVKTVNNDLTLNDDFDAELLALLEEKNEPKGLLLIFKSPLFRVAAAAVLIFGIGLLTWNLSEEEPLAESVEVSPVGLNNLISIEDQLESNSSYKKTKNTFLLIGDKMNKVVKHAEKLNKLNQFEKKK